MKFNLYIAWAIVFCFATHALKDNYVGALDEVPLCFINRCYMLKSLQIMHSQIAFFIKLHNQDDVYYYTSVNVCTYRLKVNSCTYRLYINSCLYLQTIS